MSITAQEFTEFLHEAIDLGDEDNNISFIRSFEEEGVLSSNEGLIVRLNDGSKFQITIVEC